MHVVVSVDAHTLETVMPIDASCEDVEVDKSLSFIEEYVQKSLENGAQPYVPVNERADMLSVSTFRAEEHVYAKEVQDASLQPCIGAELWVSNPDTCYSGELSVLPGFHLSMNLYLQLKRTATKEVPSDTHQSSSPPSTSSSSILEAQRHMSLYFALCTKKHSLFCQVFVIYKSIPKAVMQAVHRQIPILVRTMGSSSELLAIISDPPTGSESLLMQVLHILTDGTLPTPELISIVKRLYDSKLKDVDILLPILPSLSKDEILPIVPQLLNLPMEKFQLVLARMIQGSPQSSKALTPAKVLIAIHGIDPNRDGIPLKKVTDAFNACFKQRQLFTQHVLAKVLNQLVE